MIPLSSPDAGGGGAEDDRHPPAEAVTDPDLAAEVDNPADANPPTGEQAGPASPAAADQGPIAAPGAPGELTSEVTPSQGEERGEATPAGDVGEVPGGDAGAPESGAGPAAAPPAPGGGPPAPSSGGSGPSALDPEQEGAGGASPAAVAVQRAAEDKAAQAAAAREAAAAAAPAPSVEPDAEPAALDEARQELLARLGTVLGAGLVESHVVAGVDVWARVSVEAWRLAAEACRDQLGLSYFDYLSAIDWLPSPYGRSEDPPPADDPEGGEAATGDAGGGSEAPAVLEHGYAGGETRLQLLARLVSPTTHLGMTLKADIDDEAPVAPSWVEVYPGADWHEREVWEMYGIDFRGHPNLVHLYLPGDFEGHPLRKDFPLLAREVKPWPGLVDVEAMPGEGDGEG
ncbi:MAG TPA: NADH-quinone oxidoreductase subunit C [Acidimicrobiales bacterium]|nr:NADH-quinone oxidoreductase subunit C [Acidimicrobiales bacterium]